MPYRQAPINWTTNPEMFKEYRWLMNLRATHAALRKGDLNTYSDNDIAGFKRKASNDEVLVIVNTRNAVKNFNVPSDLQNSAWIDPSTGTTITLSTRLALQSYEYRILIR